MRYKKTQDINVGDIVTAIRVCRMVDDGQICLTIGKSYEVRFIENDNTMMIIDDKGDEHFFPMDSKWLLTKKEMRKLKLEKLKTI